MLRVGMTLGWRYPLQAHIASGRGGEVWRAQDTMLGQSVTVIVLPPFASPAAEAGFASAAAALTRLSDPGLVRVRDHGRAHGVAYVVTDDVGGESLRTLVRRGGPLDPARGLTLVARAATALAAVHAAGLAHGDLTLDDVLLIGADRLVITGTGIAGLSRPDRAGDPAADLRALGHLAYECLTGHRRPPGGDLPTTLPPAAREVVRRALTDGDTRWASAAALATAATAAAYAPATAFEPPPDPAPDRAPGTAMDPALGPTHDPALGPALDRALGPAFEPAPDPARMAHLDRPAGGGPEGDPAEVALGPALAARGTAAVPAPLLAPAPGVDDGAPPSRSRYLLLAAVAAGLVLVLVGGSVGIRAFWPASSGPGVAQRAPADGAIGLAPGNPTTSPTAGPTGVSNPSSPGAGSTAAGGGPGDGGAGAGGASGGGASGGGAGGGGGSGGTGGGGQTTTPAAPPPPPPPPAPTTATVPYLYGLGENEAVAEVRANNLTVYVNQVYRDNQCYVVGQSPEGGAVVPVGSTVTLTVAIARGYCEAA